VDATAGQALGERAAALLASVSTSKIEPGLRPEEIALVEQVAGVRVQPPERLDRFYVADQVETTDGQTTLRALLLAGLEQHRPKLIPVTFIRSKGPMVSISKGSPGGLAWLAAEWITRRRPSALGAISGAVAGLVAITPASGFVAPMPAILIGLVAGAGCFLMVTSVKGWFGYDDALDAFGIHGAGGTIGALLTGVFATRAINPVFRDAPVGLLEGNASQIGYQLVGIAVAWGFALAGTIILLKVTDLLVGVRVREDQETVGLDLTEHGEEAYNLEM